MNAIEIKNLVRDAAGESAEQQVEDYLDDEDDFVSIEDTDMELESIMKNKSIRDKVGAFADYLGDDEGFIKDLVGDKIYSVKSITERFELLEALFEVSKQQSWINSVQKIKDELINIHGDM